MSEPKTEETKKSKKGAKAHKYAVGQSLRVGTDGKATFTVAELLEGEGVPEYRGTMRHALFTSPYEATQSEIDLAPIE